MSAERARLAAEFLQEAVFRSRAMQAANASLFAANSAKAGNCGLGAKAAIALDLAPRGEELFAQLFGSELSASELELLRTHMRTWIKRQDALDRERNHFLKAFRAKHGFDRGSYSHETLAAFDSGLAEINARVARELAEHAARVQELSDALGP